MCSALELNMMSRLYFVGVVTERVGVGSSSERWLEKPNCDGVAALPQQPRTVGQPPQLDEWPGLADTVSIHIPQGALGNNPGQGERTVSPGGGFQFTVHPSTDFDAVDRPWTRFGFISIGRRGGWAKILRRHVPF